MVATGPSDSGQRTAGEANGHLATLDPPARPIEIDLSGPSHDRWGWYAVALVAYVTLALVTLALRDNVLLLNWIVGPLFPVVVLHAIPRGVRALTRRPRAS